MKKYQLFLAYYTLIASLCLFFWSIFWGPKPQSFLLALIVIPTSLYFWLIMTGHHRGAGDATEDQDQRLHVRLPLIILATLFISTLSIFVYSVSYSKSLSTQSASILSISRELAALKQELEKNNQNKELKGQFDKITSEIAAIRKDLSNSKSAPTGSTDSTVLGTETTPAGFITIKDSKNSTVNVYESKSLSSNVIGKAQFGKTYTFIDRNETWYLIMLSDSPKNISDQKQGYIERQVVKEVVY